MYATYYRKWQQLWILKRTVQGTGINLWQPSVILKFLCEAIYHRHSGALCRENLKWLSSTPARRCCQTVTIYRSNVQGWVLKWNYHIPSVCPVICSNSRNQRGGNISAALDRYDRMELLPSCTSALRSLNILSFCRNVSVVGQFDLWHFLNKSNPGKSAHFPRECSDKEE